MSAESGWQNIFRRASGVRWAAQFSQGCAGSPGSGCKHSFRRASGVRLPAQFEQGERGGVGSTSVIYWLSIIAFADILCSQLDKSFRADTDLAGASSQGKRGWLGNTVFAKPAGWGWHHSCRRASGVDSSSVCNCRCALDSAVGASGIACMGSQLWLTWARRAFFRSNVWL